MPCRVDEPVIDEGPKYAQMLCYLCREYQAGTTFSDAIDGHPALRAWWRQHEAEDAERLRREAEDARVAKAKRAALAKLTPKERALLGFNGE